MRWDYDSVPRRPFRRAMLARGVPAEALDSPDYAAVVWKIRGGAAEAEAVLQDADFPYATLDELGLCIVVERKRSVVRVTRRRGRKRAHEGNAAAMTTRRRRATDAPT